MSNESKHVNVRFNETALSGTRVFGQGEEHQISREEAERLGDSVVILGDAPGDFPSYTNSVYGDNEAARNRDPKAPEDAEVRTVGESDVEAEREVEAKRDEEPETKDASAPGNKMVGKAPVKK